MFSIGLVMAVVQFGAWDASILINAKSIAVPQIAASLEGIPEVDRAKQVDALLPFLESDKLFYAYPLSIVGGDSKLSTRGNICSSVQQFAAPIAAKWAALRERSNLDTIPVEHPIRRRLSPVGYLEIYFDKVGINLWLSLCVEVNRDVGSQLSFCRLRSDGYSSLRRINKCGP